MKPKLELLQLAGQIPLVISDEILDKIKYLCKRINRVEWSGILFYTVEGSIQKASSVKLIVKDILLMDKGSHTYTEYDWDSDVVDYQMENPEAIDWIKGHIHSHNTMDVFFSGTDMSELNDNSPNHNIYLSLIVNNFLDMTAKLAFTAEPKKFQCKDETGKDYLLTIKSELTPWMFVYNCDIQANLPEIATQESLEERIKLVEEKSTKKEQKEKEEREAKYKQNSVPNKTIQQAYNPPSWKDESYGLYGNYELGIADKADKKETKRLPNSGKYGEDRFQKGQMSLIDDSWDLNDKKFIQVTPELGFTAFILRLGNESEDFEEITDVMDDLEAVNLNPESLSTTIMENYASYYAKFFDKEIGYEGDQAFLKVLENVIEILEENEPEYVLLTPIILKLKAFGNKFEAQIKNTIIT